MTRPSQGEYPDFFSAYIGLVGAQDVLRLLEDQMLDVQFMLTDIPEEKEDYAYAEGKWTLKEVVGHVIDTERILTYRALCFARGNTAKQPGYDPDVFMKNVDYGGRSIYSLAHEFSVVRESGLILFRSFTENDLNKTGIANDWKMSVRSLVYTVAGHTIHHLNIIRSRYLT